jgi:chemotaxis protein MotB
MNATTAPRLRILTGLIGPCFLAFSLAACVSRERYDEQQLNAKHYQSKNIELESRVRELEDQNRRLRDQLSAGDAGLREAGFDTEQIDARLKNLQNIMAEIGGQPGDVTKFAVDGGYVYRMKESILFSLGSADLSNDGKKVLAEVAADINSRPHGRVYVRGHTDSTPIVKPETQKRFPRGNLELSSERALAVADVLAKDGKVADNRIVVMGFGPSEPVASNDNDANKQKNRRVEVFVADDTSAGASAGGTAKK